MLSEKAGKFLKDVLLVAGVFAVLSGSYFGFAVAERYRALTNAYLAQSEGLIQLINSQGAPRNAEESDGQ